MTQDNEFIICMAYAEKDKRFVDNMREGLESIRKKVLYQDVRWYDMNVSAGKEFETENEKHLNSANIILLLISLHFISSAYSYDVQIVQAILRHEQGRARVIPVLLRKTDIVGTQFSKLSPLPDDGRPVSKWGDPYDAYENISKGIRKAIDELKEDTHGEEPPGNITQLPRRKQG